MPRRVFLIVCLFLSSSIQGWIFFFPFFFFLQNLIPLHVQGYFFSFPSSVWFFFLIKLPTSTTPSPPPHKKLSSIIPVELLETLSLYSPRALQESFQKLHCKFQKTKPVSWFTPEYAAWFTPTHWPPHLNSITNEFIQLSNLYKWLYSNISSNLITSFFLLILRNSPFSQN